MNVFVTGLKWNEERRKNQACVPSVGGNQNYTESISLTQ